MIEKGSIIWEEFIYGGHWGSIAASAISLSVLILLNIEIKWEFLLLVYLGTQCIYSYNHYKEMRIDEISNLPRVKHIKRYDKYLPPLTIFYEITYFIVLFYFGNRISLFFGGLLMLFGLLFTERGKKLSKKIVCFKSIYTSFSWSLLTFFTILYHSCQINAAALIFFIFIFLRLMIDTIFFDIKDIESDKKEGLLTLPIIFNNRKNLLNFLVFLNFISFVPIVVGVLTKTLPLFSLFLLPLIFYSLYYIQKAKSRETDIHFLSYILVDGEYYYWPFLLFIGTMFIN